MATSICVVAVRRAMGSMPLPMARARVTVMVMSTGGQCPSRIREHHHCDCQQHDVADLAQMAPRSRPPAHGPSPLERTAYWPGSFSGTSDTLKDLAPISRPGFRTEMSRGPVGSSLAASPHD